MELCLSLVIQSLEPVDGYFHIKQQEGVLRCWEDAKEVGKSREG